MTEHSETHPGPEAMRAAVAGYVQEIHRAYVDQAATFSPGVQGRMPLMTAGRITVAAVAARNLHLLATTEELGPPRGQEVAIAADYGGIGLGPALLRPGRAARPRPAGGAGGPGVRGGQAGPRRRDRALPRGRAAGRRAVGAPGDPRRHRARQRALRPPLGTSRRSAPVPAVARPWSTSSPARRSPDSPMRRRCWPARSRRTTRACARRVKRTAPDPEAIRKAVLTAVGGRTQWMPAGSAT